MICIKNVYQNFESVSRDRKVVVMNTYGYVRVSSRDQNEDRQIFAMNELKVPKRNVYIDKQSGKDFERPSYNKMLRKTAKR